MRFVLAGVASEVGHGMVGLFRQVRCEKVRLVPVKCGIVRSGRHGKVGLDKTGFGQVCAAGTVALGNTRCDGF